MSFLKRKPREYTVQKPGWESNFKLYILPNRKALRAFIVEKFKEIGCYEPHEYMGDTCGLFHPQSTTGKTYGYMFLNKQDLRLGVISHECLHAAMAHERFVFRFGMNYGPGLEDLEDEERLCYEQQYILEAVWLILKEAGHNPSA